MNYLRIKVASPTILLLIVFLIFGHAALIQAQNCLEPHQDMNSWWKGDGDALDIRNRNNGTMHGGVTFAAGHVGQAFSFDGTNDKIAFGRGIMLNPAFMTIETWIKKDGVPQNGIENIMAKWGFDATLDTYLFGVINDNGTVRAFGAIGDGTTGDGGLSGGTIPLNTWTHIAMTYNRSSGVHKLYVNGAEVASRVRANGMFATSTNIFIGSEASSSMRYFKGLVDEPALYSSDLTAAEIQAIYNAGPSGKCKPNGLFSQVGRVTGTGIIGSHFGRSVAVSGDTMIVGAPYRTSMTGQRGEVDIFVRIGGGFYFFTTLSPSDTADGDEFGISVAISGNTLVVGSTFNDGTVSNSGAAYVYVRDGTTWLFQQKLTASDGTNNAYFGAAVAIENNTIVVGARVAPQTGAPEAGAVYVFNRSGTVWTQAHKFIPTGTSIGNEHLGTSVAISGDTIVAGAPHDDEPSQNAGSAYVYRRNGGTWSQQQKLNGQIEFGILFGTSVAIHGNTLVSGATNYFPGGTAYVFVNNGGTWSLQQRIAPADGEQIDFFGESLAIRGDTIAVSSAGDDTSAGQDGGSVYIFTRIGNVWTGKQKLNQSFGSAGAYFGIGISLSENKTLAIGAPLESIQLNNLGAVSIFNPPPKSPFDFDGDSKTDISIFRPNVGEWWYLKSSTGGNAAAQFGASTDKLTPGDFTGDGNTDIAFFRPSNGFWFVLRSEDFSFYSFPFGTNGDVPAPADFDGDGRADAAVFRPSTSTWYISKSSGGTIIQTFGQTGDVPVVADYDGDALADIAIYRVSLGQWWIQRSSLGGIAFQFGNSSDKPVQGDYTGDGKDDVAFFRPGSGEWYVLRSENQSYYSFPFGISTDVPAPGDYDGDGKFDATVFRPSSTTWFSNRTTAGTLIQAFGIAGDKPVPNAFVP